MRRMSAMRAGATGRASSKGSFPVVGIGGVAILKCYITRYHHNNNARHSSARRARVRKALGFETRFLLRFKHPCANVLGQVFAFPYRIAADRRRGKASESASQEGTNLEQGRHLLPSMRARRNRSALR